MAGPITRISIAGYKSIVQEQSIEIAPLTILAGANSSGKSSMIQPLLLLKQTLEAQYDPGPLLINGPILKFTSADQFMSAKAGDERTLQISIEDADPPPFSLHYSKPLNEPLRSIGSSLASMQDPAIRMKHRILDMIHVRGLRGSPQRIYPRTAEGPWFPGVFEEYVATILRSRNLDISYELNHLDLGRTVRAESVNESELEVRIQMASDGTPFNIADVGFGVSQALPVLVALRVAERDELVYIEQPELHLHPRAQSRMADLLASAANRGVRLIIETHSSLLLTAIQTLVAKSLLPPDMVRLHWFQRDKNSGETKVATALLDENGAFGDWPEDFDDVILSTERNYLDAVETRMAR